MFVSFAYFYDVESTVQQLVSVISISDPEFLLSDQQIEQVLCLTMPQFEYELVLSSSYCITIIALCLLKGLLKD